jgi:hypothetical protein
MGLLKTITSNNNTANGDVLNQGAVYTTVRNGATGSSASPSDGFLTPRAGNAAGTFFVRRAFTTFTLTEIKRSFALFGATLRLQASAIVNNADGVSVHIVQGSQSSSLVTSDFSNVSFTSFGSITLASISAGSVDIALNSTGLAYIKSVSESTAKLALVLSNDLVESAPSGENEAVFQSAAGGTPPQLIIDYAPPFAGML